MAETLKSIKINGNLIVQNDIQTNAEAPATDNSCITKKYANRNYIAKDTTAARLVYGHNSDLTPQMFYISENNGNPNWLVKYSGNDSIGATEPAGSGRICSKEPTQPYQLANKKYIDNAVANAASTISIDTSLLGV